MSFGDHLEELRKRVLLSLAAPIPLFMVLFLVSDPLLAWLIQPVYAVLEAHDLPGELQVLSPPEFLLTKLKLSFIAAVVITAPWIVFQAWLFVAPGLYKEERRFVYFLLPGSAVLSVAGVALLYYVMLPLMLHVLVLIAKGAEIDPGDPDLPPAAVERLAATDEVSVRAAAPPDPAAWDVWLKVPEMELWMAIADEDGEIVPEIITRGGGRIDQTFRLSALVNFTLVLLLGIVIAFQMPLVIMLLGWVGLADVQWLRARRKYALVLCGIVSAIITPADAVSMLLMLVPLYGLYELGILLVILAPARRVAEGTVLRRAEGTVARGQDGDDPDGDAS
jgi:sec-independent protein translocase protein TatC